MKLFYIYILVFYCFFSCIHGCNLEPKGSNLRLIPTNKWVLKVIDWPITRRPDRRVVYTYHQMQKSFLNLSTCSENTAAASHMITASIKSAWSASAIIWQFLWGTLRCPLLPYPHATCPNCTVCYKWKKWWNNKLLLIQEWSFMWIEFNFRYKTWKMLAFVLTAFFKPELLQSAVYPKVILLLLKLSLS